MREAVVADDGAVAALLDDGRAYVTDGVGRKIELSQTIYPGAIYRVVRTARRGT